ncbi:hypothetical protein [Nocardia aurea]|uniref:Transposase n=1 Tax=Nocardia aurea TaxID=2144174 RepID=A0ABV3FPX4_9NOCA
MYNNETGIVVGLRHDDDTEGIVRECVGIARQASRDCLLAGRVICGLP